MSESQLFVLELCYDAVVICCLTTKTNDALVVDSPSGDQDIAFLQGGDLPYDVDPLF